MSERIGLYWRLLASYLLVVVVGCTIFYLTGAAFAPLFLERHMGGMIAMMDSPMMSAMTIDLNEAYRRATQEAMGWSIMMSTLVAGAVSLYVTGRLVAPLRAMTRASQRVAAGRYGERLKVVAPGEIGALARAFNVMAEALETSERRRVDLLADVAHEFKTPLSSLQGYIQGMRDGLFQADAPTIAACERQLVRLKRLLADLSLLSRVETGQEMINPGPVAVASLLAPLEAAFTPLFHRKGVTFSLEPVRPSLRVRADKDRTGQVLTNLVDNALKHTSCGGSVQLSAQELNKNEVRFEVRDTGEGIREEDLPHLFTRFYRADKARQHDEEQGSGIGLTIAKHYVEQQGGRLGVESEHGQGSFFWFTLPSVPSRSLQRESGDKDPGTFTETLHGP